MDKIRVNLRATVNAADIRTEQHNGREHIVVPSYTLPDGVVMNGGLYPKEEIDAAFNTLDGTLAPIGHPKKDGQFVSANSAEAINAYHVGAWNRNVGARATGSTSRSGSTRKPRATPRRAASCWPLSISASQSTRVRAFSCAVRLWPTRTVTSGSRGT